ncbi:hypothetical protein ACU8KH_05529 [Lachancea thermotolerans]
MAGNSNKRLPNFQEIQDPIVFYEVVAGTPKVTYKFLRNQFKILLSIIVTTSQEIVFERLSKRS